MNSGKERRGACTNVHEGTGDRFEGIHHGKAQNCVFTVRDGKIVAFLQTVTLFNDIQLSLASA